MINRSTTIKRRLLALLANTPQGYMQAEEAIIGDLQLLVIPPPSRLEVEQIIRELDALRLITGVVSSFDGAMRWQITDAGRAALGQL